MVRRRAAAIAGTAALTTFAATVGLGANFGLFGLTQPDSRVGQLDGAHVISAVDPTPAITASVPTTPPAALPDD